MIAKCEFTNRWIQILRCCIPVSVKRIHFPAPASAVVVVAVAVAIVVAVADFPNHRMRTRIGQISRLLTSGHQLKQPKIGTMSTS